jgi:hypothetical protein
MDLLLYNITYMAIHSENTNNRLYGSFENFSDAEKLATEMRAGNYPGDNYFVRMFFAENDREAEIRANNLHPNPMLL